MYTTSFKRFYRRLIFFFKLGRTNFNSYESKQSWSAIKKCYDDKNLSIELEEKFSIYVNNLEFENQYYKTEEILIWKKIFNALFTSENRLSNNKDSICYRKYSGLNNNARLISLSGFGWSGASAIKDFLSDFPECCEILSGREIDLFKYQFSVNQLYEELLFKEKSLDKEDIVKCISIHILGLPYPKTISKDELFNRLVASKSLVKAFLRLPPTESRLILLEDLYFFVLSLLELTLYSNQKRWLEKISRQFFYSLVEFHSSIFVGSKYFILDNWIPANMIHLNNLLPDNSISISCTRNTLDSYSSWNKYCRNSIFTNPVIAPLYITLYLLRHYQFNKRIKYLNIPNNLYKIKFEEFIFNPNFGNNSDKILFNLSINNLTKSSFSRFKPESSKKNVNLFRKSNYNVVYKKVLPLILFILEKIILPKDYAFKSDMD